MSFLTAAFYKFVTLDNFEAMREPLLNACTARELRGTLLLAREGINGTLAGAPEAVHSLLDLLRQDPRLAGLEAKTAEADKPPFLRLKVRLKREIVTMGMPGLNPAEQAGTYIAPEDWNALISEPDVVTIDTRNDYEVAVGSFEGAVDPGTARFSDLPDWLESRNDLTPDTRIAMFCTGGIRCEKSTALLRSRGFREVYHLQGGILKYLEQVAPEKSLWNGECFVFDERVSVTHGLKPGSYALCRGCRHPVSEDDQRSPQFVAGVSCPHCYGNRTEAQKRGYAERQRQVELCRSRGQSHVGAVLPRKIAPRDVAPLPVLYSFRRCPYAMRARLALQVSGTHCELREVVLRDKPPEMLEASPKGSVPVLIDTHGAVIDESLDIMLWALSKSDPQKWLAPGTATQCELVAQADTGFKQHLDRYKYPNRYDNADPEQHRDAGAQFLNELDRRMHGQRYLFGGTPSLADMAIAPFVRQYAMTDQAWFDNQSWHALHAWLGSILESPLFASIMHKYPQWHAGAAVTVFPDRAERGP